MLYLFSICWELSTSQALTGNLHSTRCAIFWLIRIFDIGFHVVQEWTSYLAISFLHHSCRSSLWCCNFLDVCGLWWPFLHLQILTWLWIMDQRLDEIAELFYGVQRRNPLQGMFGDIFKVKFLTLLHLVFCNTCFAEFKYVTGLIL